MGISIWQLLIVLMIAIVLFGTKKLRNLGSDLGDAIKSFRQAVKEGDTTEEKVEKSPQVAHTGKGEVIEGQVEQRTKQS